MILFFAYLFFLLTSSLGLSSGQEIALKVWNEIKSIQSTSALSEGVVLNHFPYRNNDIDDSMFNYWHSISEKCHVVFLEGLLQSAKNNQVKEYAKEFASKFSTEDAEADIRWVLACPILAYNSRHMLSLNKDENGVFYQFSLAFNQAVVENCLRSKDYYERMHWLILWAGDGPFMHESKGERSDELINWLEFSFKDIFGGKINENDLQFWYALRFFLSLAYLCDYEDNLIGYEGPFDLKYILKVKEGFAKHCCLMVTHIRYNPETTKYETNGNLLLPAIELPNRPFPEINYRADGENPGFPRISRLLFFEAFETDFFEKLIELKEKNRTPETMCSPDDYTVMPKGPP